MYTLDETETRTLRVEQDATIVGAKLKHLVCNAEAVNAVWELLDASGNVVDEETIPWRGNCQSILDCAEGETLKLLQAAGKINAGSVAT